MKTLTETLLDTIQNKPEECCCNRHYFIVKDVKFWIVNKFNGFHPVECPYPDIAFSPTDRRKLWKAFLYWTQHSGMEVFHDE